MFHRHLLCGAHADRAGSSGRKVQSHAFCEWSTIIHAHNHGFSVRGFPTTRQVPKGKDLWATVSPSGLNTSPEAVHSPRRETERSLANLIGPCHQVGAAQKHQEAPALLRGFFIMNRPTSVLIRLEFSPAALLSVHPLPRHCSLQSTGSSNSALFCVRRNRWPAAPKNTERTQRHVCVGLGLYAIPFSLRSLKSWRSRGCA
jgi:hypothetical protein